MLVCRGDSALSSLDKRLRVSGPSLWLPVRSDVMLKVFKLVFCTNFGMDPLREDVWELMVKPKSQESVVR
jgi:hypothetical protein